MELSISFTDAELDALARVLGETLPNLGPSSLDQLTASARAERRLEALDSLRRRGVVVGRDERPEVAVPVARLVEVVCRPVVVVDVYLGAPDGGWAPHPHRLSAAGPAGVAAERSPEGLRLTPFASTDLLGRAAVVAALTEEVAPGARTVTIDGAALARALEATNPARVRAETGAGLGPGDRDVLDSLVAAFTGRRGALRLAVRPSGGHGGGLEMAWVAGPDGAWEIPTVVTPLARAVDRDRDAVEPAGPLLLAAIGGAELLATFASFAGPGGLAEPPHDEMPGR